MSPSVNLQIHSDARELNGERKNETPLTTQLNGYDTFTLTLTYASMTRPVKGLVALFATNTILLCLPVYKVVPTTLLGVPACHRPLTLRPFVAAFPRKDVELTGAAATWFIDIDVDAFREILKRGPCLLLIRCMPCNNLVSSAHINCKSDDKCTLKNLLDIGIMLCTSLKTRQTPISSTKSLQSADRDRLALRTTIRLIPNHHERKPLRFQRRRLDEEFIFPHPQISKRLRVRHVVDQNTAVCSTVKGNPQRLEALLSRSVPELQN